MTNSKLTKTESMAVEMLSKKPVSELARLAFNTAGMDDHQNNLILDALPYDVYKIATADYRKQFYMLDWVVSVCGLYYWKSQTQCLMGQITIEEFNGIVAGLRDAIEHYDLNQAKVFIMTMGAVLSPCEPLCEDTREKVFSEILDNAERDFNDV